jgi:hypothetical protein
MGSFRIKSSPQVKSGRQYRSESSVPAPADHNSDRPFPQIYRMHPGAGFRHVLLIRHVRDFLAILPEWAELAVGLNAILLAPVRKDCDGFHRPGMVAICAQARNLSQLITNPDYVSRHQDIFDRLGVSIEETADGDVLHFTEATLRAYQLLHVLLHELGHHHDRMTTRRRKRASRGEGFAEMYARTHGDFIWGRYFLMADSW